MIPFFKDIFGIEETEKEKQVRWAKSRKIQDVKQDVVRDQLNEIFNEKGISDIIIETVGHIHTRNICPCCDENCGPYNKKTLKSKVLSPLCKVCGVISCYACINNHQCRINRICGDCGRNLFGFPCKSIYKVIHAYNSDKKYFCAQCVTRHALENPYHGYGEQSYDSFLTKYSWFFSLDGPTRMGFIKVISDTYGFKWYLENVRKKSWPYTRRRR